MRVIVCNPSYGNNPYIRTTEMALMLSDKLGGDIAVVVPHVYGARQRRILLEEFGNDRRILLDEKFGSILRSLFFDGNVYEEYLIQWMTSVDHVSQEASAYLHQSYDILCEISRSPLVRLGIEPAYYHAWSRTSDVLKRAIAEPNITINASVLSAAAKKFRELESPYHLHLISIPGTFDPREGDAVIPLAASLPLEGEQDPREGVYITVSGIPDVASLQTIADRTGLPLFASDTAKIHGATQAHPGMLQNGKIVAHIARAGWGAIGTSIMTGTPIIAPEYQAHEDPEIFFNLRRMEELGLGIVFRNQTSTELMQAIEALRPSIHALRRGLLKRFGGMDGADVGAEIIKRHLTHS